MRVVLATNSRDRGSTSRTLEAWARLLPAHGVDAVVTVGGGGPLLTALQEGGVSTRVVGLRAVPRLSWPFPFAASVLRLAATVRRSNASLIHVNEHDNHIVAAYAAAIARVPVVTHVRFRPDPAYCRWLFREGRTPALLLFTTHTQLEDCAAGIEPVVPRQRWRVMPNGLDFSTFGNDVGQRARLRQEWNLPAGAVAVGTACAISQRKRVDHFIRLIARLRAAGVPAHGFVAGQAYYEEDERLLDSLRQLAASLGLREHLTFLGYVEPSEPLYHAWDVCVSTSAYETFGMTVLEAMACGCPVVTYPGGSVAEIVGDAALVVRDGDEDALFAQCLQLARSEDARGALARRARTHAEKTYDIRAIVPRLAAEYRELVSERRSPREPAR